MTPQQNQAAIDKAVIRSIINDSCVHLASEDCDPMAAMDILRHEGAWIERSEVEPGYFVSKFVGEFAGKKWRIKVWEVFNKE